MELKYSLDDLRLFCSVAELGSFKKAAESLSMPLSTLSRRIRHLEDNLQLRLLNRDAHRVLLTHAGEQYFQRFNLIFEEINHLTEDLHNDKSLPKGKIRICAPISASENFLYPIFADFGMKYPDIQLDLHVSNDLVDIESEAIDVVFRVGNPMVESWIARPLVDIQFILCSSPDTDISNILEPSDLDGKPAVVCRPMKTWQLVNENNQQEFDYQPTKSIRMEGNEVQMGVYGVKEGIGIGYLPDYLAYPKIKSGELVQVLPDWKSKARTLFMLYQEREHQPRRVRLLIEFVISRFSQEKVTTHSFAVKQHQK